MGERRWMEQQTCYVEDTRRYVLKREMKNIFILSGDISFHIRSNLHGREWNTQNRIVVFFPLSFLTCITPYFFLFLTSMEAAPSIRQSSIFTINTHTKQNVKPYATLPFNRRTTMKNADKQNNNTKTEKTKSNNKKCDWRGETKKLSTANTIQNLTWTKYGKWTWNKRQMANAKKWWVQMRIFLSNEYTLLLFIIYSFKKFWMDPVCDG